MLESDAVGFRIDRALAGGYDRICAELAVFFVVELAQHADADLHEVFAGFGFVVADGGFAGTEFFHGAHDGVVQCGFVAVKPFAEKVVALVSEAFDDAVPIETGAAIVAFFGIGQKNVGFDDTVGNFRLRKLWICGDQ